MIGCTVSPNSERWTGHTVRRLTLYAIPGMVCVSSERESDDGMRHRIVIASAILVSCLPSYAQTQVSPRIWRPERSTMPAAWAPGPIIASSQSDWRLAGLPIEERDTPFVTEWSLPITAFWGGHLVLAGFESTVHMQRVQFRSPLSCSLPASSDQATLARASSGNGIRLELHLGRIKRRPQPWRLLVRWQTSR